ncbi:hypothetical protein NDU88_001473 [Pleurodeles waltl]|uniref:Uncharacterized protein n=1 Tax=Pleurodeles waltl TaxID=8319 RepID=A0AAV7SBQ7_PLEWA|nr:hypothetical protein NDU88_001473 [Pleurodeles waltl]
MRKQALLPLESNGERGERAFEERSLIGANKMAALCIVASEAIIVNSDEEEGKDEQMGLASSSCGPVLHLASGEAVYSKDSESHVTSSVDVTLYVVAVSWGIQSFRVAGSHSVGLVFEVCAQALSRHHMQLPSGLNEVPTFCLVYHTDDACGWRA